MRNRKEHITRMCFNGHKRQNQSQRPRAATCLEYFVIAALRWLFCDISWRIRRLGISANFTRCVDHFSFRGNATLDINEPIFCREWARLAEVFPPKSRFQLNFEEFWSKKLIGPTWLFCAIIPHQKRSSDPKSERVLKTPPSAMNPLLRWTNVFC